MNTPAESSVLSAIDVNKTGKDTTLTEQGECNKPVSMEDKGHAVINGHIEIGNASYNGLVRVKQERPSTPPPSLDGPGDSNNNIQDKKVPLSTNVGSVSLSNVPDSSIRSQSSFSTSTESGVENSEGSLSATKNEEEPLSPIPALVPVGGQTAYVKSEPSTSQGKTKACSNITSSNSHPSVKSEVDGEGTEKSVELTPSVGSSEVALKPPVGSPKAEPTGESKPQMGSDTRVKRENELRIATQSGAPVGSEVKEESQVESVQSLSDDDEDGVGAMGNLLCDITQIQDDLEERMDDIEQQLAG